MNGKTNDGEQQQIIAARLSISASIIMFLISAVIGIAVDSITLILDASAGLVILFMAFLMYVSIRKVHRPPDDLYNFGYGKYEPLTVSIQGILIIATCVISIKFAIQDIVHEEEIHSYFIPTVSAGVVGIIGIIVTRYLSQTARRTASAMLKTASLHWRADTILSFGMCFGFLIGFLLHTFGYTTITPYVDPVMAIALALFLIQSPLKASTYNILELLDAAPHPDIRDKVMKVVEEYKPRSFGVQRLRTRKAGEKIFVDVCFIVKGNLTVEEVEKLANNLEQDLHTHLPHSDVVVYFKPARGQKNADAP